MSGLLYQTGNEELILKAEPIIIKYKRLIFKYPRKIRYRRQTKFKRVLTRVRRVNENEGSYKPGDDHVLAMYNWGKKLSNIEANKLKSLSSLYARRDQFYSVVGTAISYVVTHYPIFKDPAEFEKLCKTSIKNRIKDNVRNLFRKKRFGQELPIPDTAHHDEDYLNGAYHDLKDLQFCSENPLVVMPDLNYDDDEKLCEVFHILDEREIIRLPQDREAYLKLMKGGQECFEEDFRNTHKDFFERVKNIVSLRLGFSGYMDTLGI